MDIENNKSPGEEEYRPADYEDTSSAFEAAPASDSSATVTAATGSTSVQDKMANLLEHLKRRNIVIAIVVIVAVFCLYKIVDVIFAPGDPRSHKTTAQVPHAQMPAPIQQTSFEKSMQRTNAESIATASVANRLNTVEQQLTAEKTDLTQLTSQINDLQSNIGNINTKLNDLTSAVQMMAGEMTRQQAALAAKEAAKRKAASAAKLAPKPVYYVKALVPGRAWLASQNGETITVSLGNDLPGYGRVEAIDPAQGTLTTDSGAIIGYSSGDS